MQSNEAQDVTGPHRVDEVEVLFEEYRLVREDSRSFWTVVPALLGLTIAVVGAEVAFASSEKPIFEGGPGMAVGSDSAWATVNLGASGTAVRPRNRSLQLRKGNRAEALGTRRPQCPTTEADGRSLPASVPAG